MPSGYTSDLYEGKPQTFEQFVLSCARAFGALIMMRDEPWDATIPEKFEPSDYHDRALAEAEQRLERVVSMSQDDLAAELRTEGLKRHRMIRESQVKARAVRERCEAMLAEVEAWTPPTSDHDGLKKFMREQLEETIRFDGDERDYYSLYALLPDDPREYRQQQIEKAKRDIAYHTDERRKEIERTESRNAWVAALRESLPADSNEHD